MMNLAELREQLHRELTDNIMPFHMNHMVDEVNGGFYGKISDDLIVDTKALKGSVQCARLLWSYAHAYRVLHDAAYIDLATYAYNFLLDALWDEQNSGVFWMVDNGMLPVAPAKLIYAQAFAIYGLSEFYLATGNGRSLEYAITLFELLETYAVDRQWGGYWEGCTPDWQPDLQMAVDDVNQPIAKSMNTHLHILEAYTNLYRVWPDARLRNALTDALDWTLTHIVNGRTGQFILHLDAQWHPLNDYISYGHDIEGSWLLWETAEILDDPALLARTRPVVLKMAEASLAGIDVDGGIWNEGSPMGFIDKNKDWWPQAEGMVGFFNAYQLSGNGRFLEAALNCWQFIQNYVIDYENGEWFRSIDENHQVVLAEKAGMWKTPYHNGRACLEMMRRIHSSNLVKG